MITSVKAPDFDGTQPCRAIDLEYFFPVEREEVMASLQVLKPICDSCKFQSLCLEWALENREYGIWAGTTDDQRRSILRKRRRAVK